MTFSGIPHVWGGEKHLVKSTRFPYKHAGTHKQTVSDINKACNSLQVPVGLLGPEEIPYQFLLWSQTSPPYLVGQLGHCLCALERMQLQL